MDNYEERIKHYVHIYIYIYNSNGMLNLEYIVNRSVLGNILYISRGDKKWHYS